ncbi:MAG: hypothetical protein N3H31_05790 [Candidatus Nezhaarchaeota archaeon]|nr:hypothetical protein [Candidatus Nezhaarchaeota archaeon]
MKIRRWREDALFIAKLLVAILVIVSIACFFLWNDPVLWVRELLKALGFR